MLFEKFQGHSEEELNYQVTLLLAIVFTFILDEVNLLWGRGQREPYITLMQSP